MMGAGEAPFFERKTFIKIMATFSTVCLPDKKILVIHMIIRQHTKKFLCVLTDKYVQSVWYVDNKLVCQHITKQT